MCVYAHASIFACLMDPIAAAVEPINARDLKFGTWLFRIVRNTKKTKNMLGTCDEQKSCGSSQASNL